MAPTFFSSKINQILVAVMLGMIILSLAAYAVYTGRSATLVRDTASITIDGEGEVRVSPNIAQFSFTVTTKDKTADAAQSSTSAKMTGIIGAIKAAGVEDKDIKTDDFNIYPHYPLENPILCSDTICPPSQELKPDGFEASQTVTVKVRDLTKVGMLVAEATKKGATGIGGIGFSIEDKKPNQAVARDMAMADANAKAQKIAQGLNLKIKRVTSFYENSDPGTPYAGGYEMDAKALSSTEPLLPSGEQTIKSSISVTYEVE